MDCLFDEARFLKDLVGLLRIRSENRDADTNARSPLGQGVHDAIEYVLAKGREYGLRTKDVDGYCGYVEMGEGPDLVGILTHIDTVPAGDGWSSDPFDGVLHNGRLYGRGACDDKGPTMLALHAMQAVQQSGTALSKRIRLIFGGDEESGVWKCMEHYRQVEEIPVCSFSPDASYPAVFAEKGILRVRFAGSFAASVMPMRLRSGIRSNIVPPYAEAEIAGEKYEARGVPAHSMAPYLGDNALIKLCGDLRARGFRHPFLDLVGVANVRDLHIDLADEPSGELTINPSLAVTTEQSGELIADIRYPVTLDEEDLLQRMNAVVGPLGFTATKESGNAPLYLPADMPFIRLLQGAYRDVTGDATPPSSTGGCTYARAFPNAVAFGVMLPTTENTCHMANEYWSVADMHTNFAIMTKTLLAVQQMDMSTAFAAAR